MPTSPRVTRDGEARLYDRLRVALEQTPARGAARSKALARALRGAVASGAIQLGQRLPTVRALCAALAVHPRVVQAAYAELRRDGLIGGRTGAGTVVLAPPSRSSGAPSGRLRALVDDLMHRALAEGYAPEEIEAAVVGAGASWRAERQVALDRQRGGRGLLLAGSHDLCIEVLAAQLGAGRHPVRLLPRFSDSLTGLFRVAAGEADLAGVHLVDPATGAYNVPYVRRILDGRPARLWLVAEREQGLMVSPENPRGLAGVVDLGWPGIRLANRQAGSGTRALLDHLLHKAGIEGARISGYARELPTHLAVAQAVARGEADVGVGIEAAARPYGLTFIPLAREPYELALLDDRADDRPFVQVRRVLLSDAFRSAVQALGGYVTDRSGAERTVH